MQSKQSIVTIGKNGLTLNTGLSSRQFANAKMGQYVTEPGIFVSTQNGEYTTEEFRFTDTQTILNAKSDNVVLINDSIQGKTLLEVIEKSETSKVPEALNQLSNIIEWSFSQNIEISNCGPLGTIVTEKGFLFLPFELFERSLLAQNKEDTSLFYGCWTNTALSHIDSWRFTLSTYYYTGITKQKPYPETDREKRAEDYFDNNFIPLHLLVKVDDSLSIAVNKNLSLTSTAHQSIKPIKQKSKAQTLASHILETGAKNNTNTFSSPLPISTFEITEAKSEERELFKQKKAKELRKKRFFRKYKTVIAVCALITIFIGFVAGSIIQSNLSKPTTEGMTESQVVQTFYSALNTLDSATLDSCGDSSAIGNYSNMVSTLFVSGKMREAYEKTVPFLPPAQWIGTDNPTELSTFGLTNLVIQQQGLSLHSPKKGDSAHFTVTFYTIINQGEDYYEITESFDTLTLAYGRKHWQITELISNTQQIYIDNAKFIEDVIITRELIKEDSTIELHEQGMLLTETLRETYPWLPTEQEVKASVELIPVYLLESQE